MRGIRIPYEFYYNSDYEKPGINKKSLFLDADDWIESGAWEVKFFQKSEGIQAFPFCITEPFEEMPLDAESYNNARHIIAEYKLGEYVTYNNFTNLEILNRLFPQKVKIEPMKNVKEYKAYEK